MSFSFIHDHLRRKQQQGLFREKQIVSKNDSGAFIVNGKQYLNFASNDYLGIAASSVKPNLKINSEQSGSGGSPLLSGHTTVHRDLEALLLDWLGYNHATHAALLFSSGFAANTGTIETLMNHKNSLIVQDKLNHASLIDGGLHSVATMKRYRSNDLTHLKNLLNTSNGRTLAVTEGVFSMDGHQGDLTGILNLLGDRNRQWLMVDDAHGIGCLGENGKGSIHRQGLNVSDIDLYVGTFGKALGSQGAFVVAKKPVISYLENECRHYIYSTSLSPIQAAATIHNIETVIEDDWRREKLAENIACFKAACEDYDIPLLESRTAIQPILVPGNQNVLSISEQLKDEGYWCSAIRSPTVNRGKERLRVTLSSLQELSDIRCFVTNIHSALRSLDEINTCTTTGELG